MIFPSSLWILHNQIARDFINSSFTNATLLVFKKKVACNCTVDPVGQKPAVGWVSGGRIPFSATCQNCDGSGYRFDETTVSVKQSVYHSPKDWIRVSEAKVLENPNNYIQTRTLIENYPNILKSDHMLLPQPEGGYGNTRYKLAGAPIPHGMCGDGNELICVWERIE